MKATSRLQLIHYNNTPKTMCTIFPCKDVRDGIAINPSMPHFAAKPIASCQVTVELPSLRTSGYKSVSNWEIMEKIKSQAMPDEILGIKVFAYMLFCVHIKFSFRR